MPEPEDRYDRLILWIVTHVRGRTVAILAGISYLGVGLALPLLAGLPPLVLFDLNVIGTIFAGSLLFGWFLVQLAAKERRQLLEWTSDLRLLDAREFELLVGELLQREGWAVTHRGRQDGPDGNVDLEIRRERERRIVQAKRWQSWLVPVDEVREFGGTLMREGLSGKDGIYVTLSDFTEQAREEAKMLGLDLVDGADLYARVEKVRQPVICETCKVGRMVLDRSPFGWWYRCVTPGCVGKTNLGADAVRVIALLNEPK